MVEPEQSAVRVGQGGMGQILYARGHAFLGLDSSMVLRGVCFFLIVVKGEHSYSSLKAQSREHSAVGPGKALCETSPHQSEVTNQAKFCFYSSIYLIKGDIDDLLCRMVGPAEAEPGAQTLAEAPAFYLYGASHLLPPTFDC